MKYICNVCNAPCQLDTGDSEVSRAAEVCPLEYDTARWELDEPTRETGESPLLAEVKP